MSDNLKAVAGGLVAGVGLLGIAWGMILRDVKKQEEKALDALRKLYEGDI